MASNSQKKNVLKVLIIVVFALLIFMISVLISVKGFFNNHDTNQDANTGNALGFSAPSNNDNNVEAEASTNKVKNNEQISAKTNSTVLVMLKNSGWDRMKANLNNYEIDSEGTYTFSDGYKLYCNETYVNYIVFTKNFKGKVIEDITVGTPISEVKEILGKPSFEEEGIVGYRTGEYYAFFYENEIVVYPNNKLTNTKLEKLLFTYNSGAYRGNRTNLIVEFRQNYKDFTIKEYGGDIVLSSLARQMQITLSIDGSMQITLFRGYNMGTEMNSHLSDRNITTKDDYYLVEEYEVERVNA